MLPYFIICMIFLANTTYANQEENWMSHWFQGAQFAKSHDFKKSIEEYTKAIDSLDKNNISNHLYLYNERGNAYFNFFDFEHAIQDFDFVFNNQLATQEVKADALWGRSRAYLSLGKPRKFEEDINALEKIEPIYTLSHEEGKEYVVFKLAPRFRMNKDIENSFIKTLLMRHSINSEKDIVFTESGIGILKKSNSCDSKIFD
jgi:tetratricopeptide (TPR) repeat protein